MNLLTFEEVLDLHDASIDEHGGRKGIIAGKEDAIRFAIEQPNDGIGDQDYYPTIEEKAAAVGFSLTMGHCFIDGNKRIGFLAMFVFLEKNGYTLTADNQEVIDFMLDLAADRATRQDLVLWVRKYIAPRHEENIEEDGPLSFGESSPISDAVRQIEAERPPFWKGKIFVQVLEEEIAKCVSQRAEHKAGYSSAPKRALEQFEFFRWVTAEMNKRWSIISEQKKILSFLSDASFSEDEGDLTYMISMARELGGIYEDTIRWSQQFRRIDMPPEYGDFLNIFAIYFEELLSQIEQIPAIFSDAIDNAEATDGIVHVNIFLKYGLDDDDTDVLDDEFHRLLVRLGLEDERGFKASDYVDKGLHGAMSCLNKIAIPVNRYIGCSVRWSADLALLENRPASIARPKKEAIAESTLQNTLGLTRTMKDNLGNFSEHVEMLEKYGPLLGDLIDPANAESVENVREFLGTVRSIRELTRLVQRLRERVADVVEWAQDLSPRLASASAELLGSADDYDQLIARLVSACDTQIQVVETRLPA